MGEPMHGWPVVTLGDVAEDVTVGYVGPMASEYVESAVPFLRSLNVEPFRINTQGMVFVSREFHQKIRKSALRPGDVVVVRTGRPGAAAVVPNLAEEMNCSDLVIIRPGPDLDSVFLASYINASAQQQVAAHLVGAVQQHYNIGAARQLRIPLPPLREQRAIAEVIGTLVAKIELNRRMNETLEAMARALFQSWFVDFDPVRAKAEGRQPPAMDTQTAALFPDGFEESPLGKIPLGWACRPLPDAIHVNPPRPLRQGESAPYLDMRSMPTSGHRPSNWITRSAGSGARFISGDTLLARITPCLENGKTAFVDFLGQGQTGWGSTEYIVLRPRPPLPPEYAYYLARSPELRAHAILNMTGTSGRQRVPASCFDQFRIAIPPALIARRFEESVRCLMARIRANQEQSATLAALRDALLPKLLAGEIRVLTAEELAGAAM